MAFELSSNNTIGPYKQVKVNEVKVTKSMQDFVDKCVIKIPITARVVQKGLVVTESAETARLIEEGMAVNIKLGYNGVLKEEFDGFVARVNPVTPTEIECEGWSFVLRNRTYLKTFKHAQLLDILKYLVAGTGIELETKKIPSFVIDKLVLNNHNGCEALREIRKVSDENIFFFFTGKKLFGGLKYLDTKSNVRYRIGWNVLKDNALKLRQAKNQDVVVKYIGVKRDGTTEEIQTGRYKSKVVSSANSGSKGETKVIKSFGVTDKASLKAMADTKLRKLQYDGYEGKITAYLEPYCEPGYKAILEDLRYPERGGNYLVESTEVTYGANGGRRIVQIGLKV